MLKRGASHRGVVRVRPDRAEASLDGALVSAFDPRQHTMGLDRSMWRHSGPPALGLGIWNGRVAFSKVHVLELDLGGVPLPTR